MTIDPPKNEPQKVDSQVGDSREVDSQIGDLQKNAMAIAAQRALDDGAANPYAPPVSESYAERPAHALTGNTLAGDVQAVPDPDFWAVSFLIIGLLLVGMFLFYNYMLTIGLVTLVSFVLAILRVCFVYSRRARAGLPPLPYGSLLFTSTLISFGILVSSGVTFFTTCSMTIPFVFGSSKGLELSMFTMVCIVSLAAGGYLFVKSFELSM